MVPEELLERIKRDLAGRTGTPEEAIRVVRADPVTWRDGSLGCPQPGRMYTQALVEGYRVILEAGGRAFDYRAARSGPFLLCEEPPAGEVLLLPEPGGEADPPVRAEREAVAHLAGRLEVPTGAVEVVASRLTEVPAAAPCQGGALTEGLVRALELVLEVAAERHRYVAVGPLLHHCGPA